MTTQTFQQDLFKSGDRLPPVKPSVVKQLFRLDEVSQILSISVGQIRNLLDAGTLQGTLINGATNPQRKHVRVKRQSIEKFLADRKRQV